MQNLNMMPRFLFLLFFINLSMAQQINNVDFIKCDAVVYPNVTENSISGFITYHFKVKNYMDTIKIDAKKMTFSDVLINGKSIAFKNSGKTLDIYEGFKIGNNKLSFRYLVKPKQALYFTGKDDNLQIWTQGQGKYTSYWLPSFDDVNEKVIFNISISFKNNFDFFSNGFFKSSVITNDSNLKHYKMQKPMSSYLVMLAIGNFEKQNTITKSGTLLEFYLDKNDVSKFEATYRYSKQLFEYLECEIGVRYPWGIYRQIPVRDFLYAGMENTTSTIFSQDFVVDEIGFNDQNYVNVNAHELAHQWFGNLITAKSGKHHWLQEGFATYYALLAERQLFGDDYFYNELNEYAQLLNSVSATDTIAVMDEKASSLSFYKKGAWALHVLREDIGIKNFQKAVKKYLKIYAYKNVNTDDFLKIVKQVSGYDIENFKKAWLETSGFNLKIAQKYLNKNRFIQEYNTIQQTKKSNLEAITILQSNVYYPIKEYIIFETVSESFENRKLILQKALSTNDIIVRRAVAKSLPTIPEEFRQEYETLLNDNSYITKEIALTNLWKNFPEMQRYYLEQTKSIIGSNDKSFKINWLFLALNTKDFSTQERNDFYLNLLNYASENFESSVRQNALEKLLRIDPYQKTVIEKLFQATTHHKWQFSKFARDSIRKHLKDVFFKNMVENLRNESNEIDKERYQKFLNELYN